ncbi:MAG: hypothetical protein RLZZ422_107 [Pseudomonadota bacterium]
MSRTQQLALAIALPLVLLAANATWHLYQRSQGVEVRLPIRGFDPRDLLAGHYLTYKVDYNLGDFCNITQSTQRQEHTICLEPLQSIADSTCILPLSGMCSTAGFNTGLERFYIPEQYAQALDQAIRDQKGEIVIMVKNGKGTVKDLIIDNKNWLEFAKSTH